MSSFYKKFMNYIRNDDGALCPFCGSDDLSAKSSDFDGCYLIVTCLSCGKIWSDIYKIIGARYDNSNIYRLVGVRYHNKEYNE